MVDDDLKDILMLHPECGMIAHIDVNEGDANVLTVDDDIGEDEIEVLIELAHHTFSDFDISKEFMVCASEGKVHISMKADRARPKYLVAICRPSIDLEGLVSRMKSLVA